MLTREERKAAALIKPMFRYILVKKIPVGEKKTAGGVILPSNLKENAVSHANKAILIALGSKAFEFESEANKPEPGVIVHFTRYEDFIIDHSTESLDGEYAMIYDEYVTAIERK